MLFQVYPWGDPDGITTLEFPMGQRSLDTVELLRINDPFRVALREELMAEGLFPLA
jgi:hypothetical protein